MLSLKGNGVHFFDPAKQCYHHRVADGYVDDVTGFCNTFEEDLNGHSDPTRLADLMKMDADLWNSLLTLSGGALEPTKCFWYAMVPDETTTLASKDSLSEGVVSIALKTDNAIHTPVTLRDSTEPHTTLGCVKAPNGDQSFQAAALCKKSKDIAKKLAATILSREEAFIACQAIITPSLSYPLATSWLSEKQLTAIQSPYMGIIARQSGFSKNTSRAILFGPPAFGGYGLTSLGGSQAGSH